MYDTKGWWLISKHDPAIPLNIMCKATVFVIVAKFANELLGWIGPNLMHFWRKSSD